MYINITFFLGDMLECHSEVTLYTEAKPGLTINAFRGITVYMLSPKECDIYSIIPNVPFLKQITSLID